MPNTIQHSLWPFVWTLAVGVAIAGASPFILAAAVICGIPMGIFSALPDLYGIWGGSSPGFSPFGDPKNGDWALYTDAHHGKLMEKHKKNPLYAFHLWQDLYSHGDPDYLVLSTSEKQSKYWDILNDVLVVGLLSLIGGVIFAFKLIVAVCAVLYVFKLISWGKNALQKRKAA